MFLLACHMFDKNKFNLIHFEFFSFTVPSYFRSVSIMEGFPYKQDSSFSRDCTIATFLLYWVQKGMTFLKWELQDVIYIFLFLSVHHSRLWYICGYSRRLFGLFFGFGCKVTCPFHLTWCGFFHIAVLDIAIVSTFSRSYLWGYFCLCLGSFISINNSTFFLLFSSNTETKICPLPFINHLVLYSEEKQFLSSRSGTIVHLATHSWII